MTESFALSGDLASVYIISACVLAAASALLLIIELIRSTQARKGALLIALSGLCAAALLLLAVLRPVAVRSKVSLVGSKVIVLADGSHSIDLPGLSNTRRESLKNALTELSKRSSEVRFALLRFGESQKYSSEKETQGEAAIASLSEGSIASLLAAHPYSKSDLQSALEQVAGAADERPAAIVVLSDGRLDRPSETSPKDEIKNALGHLQVPVHTVALATAAPADASIRAIRTAGAAVAHQPLSLRIEIGCDGGLSCDEIPVFARELREQGDPTPLASGTAHVENGKASLELQVTLDRAGTRILEIEIKSPKGDTILENDKRLFTIDVTRERVRVLHVAGRPTYDVRALRMWLKSDTSVDVVAFFILRTLTDDVNASQDDLALIPFPVDELFSVHLSSFDAVVLQDFDARPYDLEKHLPALARYVEKGGGLIMVGGPDSFVPGHYAATPLARVLPVELPPFDRRTQGIDLSTFIPRFTEAGRMAPVLSPLRSLIGEELPEMPGANLVGDARPDATVLLTHPTLKTAKGAPMPLLSLGEPGSGRTIALALDGSHKLLFSAFAANASGRAHGAFWDAMLGWLMRDPRFEPAVIDIPGSCIAGEESILRLKPLAGQRGRADITITRLGSGEVVKKHTAELNAKGEPILMPLGRMAVGGYSALVEMRPGASGTTNGEKGSTTRRDFACEKGGDEWADSRPDPERLAAISEGTQGRHVEADDVGQLPLPKATQVAAERHVTPILPAWAWSLLAAFSMGVHWITRRRGGLS